MTSIFVPVRSTRFISFRLLESCACARQTKAVAATVAAIHLAATTISTLPAVSPA